MIEIVKTGFLGTWRDFSAKKNQNKTNIGYADFIKYNGKVGQVQEVNQFMPKVKFTDGSEHSVRVDNMEKYNASSSEQQKIREQIPFRDGRDNQASCDGCGVGLNMHNAVMKGGGIRSCRKCENN